MFLSHPTSISPLRKTIIENSSGMKKEVKLKNKLMDALVGDIQNCMEVCPDM
jgi:hypothetical protein